ncbi:MFS transporter [Alkalihalobacterium chitinilyticum]|uniref:MFS transporter n=1 Tax=Alkalihalobacterium chitinilyticum TaxID=2980103 RepID=A0ABT5VEP5_9BACI|nr:MFS transporter [Alkalihalobacterium chitinilyticum]MDE5413172.1 MFS transporter [Alkalihalobacterium chitinilyticum]
MKQSSSFHKGWFMLILIVLSVLACLGFGRFSFGAILPFMKEGLLLDYRETGLIASSIFLGYLVAVLLSGFFVLKYTAKRVIVASLIVIAIGMLITANSPSFLIAYIGCFLTGLGTGGSYVPSLGLISQWFSPKKRGMAMGTAMAGSGIGMVFSGFVVPALVVINIDQGWRLSWYLLAFLVIIIALLNWILLKNKPEDVGLHPIGATDSRLSQIRSSEPSVAKPKNVYRNKTLWFIGSIYFLWGVSYLIFSTFLVDYLITDVKFTSQQAGNFFAAAGIASIISGFVWGSVSDKVGRMVALMIVFFTQFLMLMGLSFSTDSFFIFMQVIIYGSTLWGVPTIMNASVGDYIDAKYIPVAMGFVTIFFSAGQLVSPIVTGLLIDYTNSYLSAHLLSAITCLVCGIGCYSLFYNERKKAALLKLEL